MVGVDISHEVALICLHEQGIGCHLVSAHLVAFGGVKSAACFLDVKGCQVQGRHLRVVLGAFGALVRDKHDVLEVGTRHQINLDRLCSFLHKTLEINDVGINRFGFEMLEVHVEEFAVWREVDFVVREGVSSHQRQRCK